MDGVFSAYFLTLGVITYRWISGPKQPPPPVAFLGATVIFGATTFIASADKKLGNAVAWAFLIGALVAPKSNIMAVKRIAGAPTVDDITNPTVINPNDAPQGTYANGQTGPTNGGPDVPGGVLLGPGGQNPVKPNPPGVIR